MGNVRGLRTRLCPECKEVTAHRTLYVKTASGGRAKWFQLFWACAKCGSLNHIVLPAYRLERASTPLPTALATEVVNALEE
jgi:RNase P subunit RPR2